MEAAKDAKVAIRSRNDYSENGIGQSSADILAGSVSGSGSVNMQWRPRATAELPAKAEKAGSMPLYSDVVDLNGAYCKARCDTASPVIVGSITAGASLPPPGKQPSVAGLPASPTPVVTVPMPEAQPEPAAPAPPKPAEQPPGDTGKPDGGWGHKQYDASPKPAYRGQNLSGVSSLKIDIQQQGDYSAYVR